MGSLLGLPSLPIPAYPSSVEPFIHLTFLFFKLAAEPGECGQPWAEGNAPPAAPPSYLVPSTSYSHNHTPILAAAGVAQGLPLAPASSKLPFPTAP